jgi:PGF-CTERM protein
MRRRRPDSTTILAAMVVCSMVVAAIALGGIATADGSSADETYAQDDLDGQLVWAGQEVEVTGFDADEELQLWSDSGGFETQLRADSEGQVTIETDERHGEYTLQDERGDERSFVVTEQWLHVSADSYGIEWYDDATETTLWIDSLRTSYDVEVSSENLSGEEIAALFDADTEDVDDGALLVEDAGGEHTLSLAALEAGEYDLDVTVTDTEVTESVTLSVPEIDPEAGFEERSTEADRGDVAEFTVELEDTDEADVRIGGEEVGYEADLTVVDGTNDGTVTVSVNTLLAGSGDGAAYSAADDGDEVIVEDEGDLDAPLDPAAYELETGADLDDATQDLSVLAIEPFDLGDATAHVVPADGQFADAEAIEGAATERDEIAAGDRAVLAVYAPGLSGAFAADELDGVEHTVTVEAPGENSDDVELGPTDVIAGDDGTHYVVVDTDHEAIEAGDRVEIGVEVDESLPVADESDGASATVEVVEPAVTVSDEEIEVVDEETGDRATLAGESSFAPGTELTLHLRSVNGTPFADVSTAEIASDGSWEVETDLSDVALDTEIEIRSELGGVPVGEASTVSLSEGAVGEERDETTTESPPESDDDGGETDVVDTGGEGWNSNGESAPEQAITGEDQPGFGVVVALLALAAAVGAAVHARR